MFLMIIGCGKRDATSVISGTVTMGEVGQGGVTINLTGYATATTTTASDGTYSFTNVENGTYTVTPYLDGYTFSASTDVTVNGTSVTGIDFTSTFAGYSISGTVTGDVAANVTITLTGPLLGAFTTASNGDYSAPGITVSGSYTLTPSLAGYKFTPYSKSVSMNSASLTGIDFVSEFAHTNGTASGYYTWDSTNHVLTITWATSTLPCNWPKVSPVPETESGVTISTTAMTWPSTTAMTRPGVMLWTRTSGSANDPAGTWTATDESGNTYTAIIDSASGTISLTGNIVACAFVWAEYPPGDYKIWLSYQDPTQTASSVVVTGAGISSSTPLTYNASKGEWNTSDASLDIGASPASPYIYTFTITDAETTWTETSCFVGLPTGLAPAGAVKEATPTFSWTAIGDAGAQYVVRLLDSSHNLIWESAETTDTSVVYSGTPALVSGNTYYYYVIVIGTTACSNGLSYAEGSFTYNP